MNYISLDNLALVLNDLIDQVSDIAELRKLVNSSSLFFQIEETLLANDTAIDEDQILIEKYEKLDTLIKSLASYEDELNQLKLNRMQSIEEIKTITEMMLLHENNLKDTNIAILENSRLKTCPSCGTAFHAVNNTKVYCSNKCRERERKRRQRDHG